MAATHTSPDAVVVAGDGPVALGQLTRVIAAAASLGAAAVHASALSQHTFDLVHTAVFITMTVFQAFWAYLVLRSVDRSVLLSGAVGHGVIVLLWLVSRTSGMPSWLPGASGAEPVGLKDVAATVLAVVAVACVDVLSRRDLSVRPVRASRAGAAVGAFVVGSLVLAGAGAFATGHEHTPAAPADSHAVPDAAHDH